MRNKNFAKRFAKFPFAKFHWPRYGAHFHSCPGAPGINDLCRFYIYSFALCEINQLITVMRPCVFTHPFNWRRFLNVQFLKTFNSNQEEEASPKFKSCPSLYFLFTILLWIWTFILSALYVLELCTCVNWDTGRTTQNFKPGNLTQLMYRNEEDGPVHSTLFILILDTLLCTVLSIIQEDSTCSR